MSSHLAFMVEPYLGLVKAGQKTIESRFSKNAHPARRCEYGDTIYFKRSGGGVECKATAGDVIVLVNLLPSDISNLRHLYDDKIKAEESFWLTKAASRNAVLIEINDVQEFIIPKQFLPTSQIGWISGWSFDEVEL